MAMSGSHIRPALAMWTWCWGSFTAAAGTPMMMARGTSNWAAATPRLPPAALRPRARPFFRSG
jgi:hypothetical protein